MLTGTVLKCNGDEKEVGETSAKLVLREGMTKSRSQKTSTKSSII